MAKLTSNTLFYRLSGEESITINTLTSAMDVIDNVTRIKMENMLNGTQEIGPEEDYDLYTQLKQRGYLYENEEEERLNVEKLKLINTHRTKQRANTTFTICPTMGCNLRCTYCFESNSQHTNLNTLTDDQMEGLFGHISKVAVQFKELYDRTPEDKRASLKGLAPSINLFGGEPLLKTNYQIVEKICEFAKSVSVPVKIITNGTTIKHYEPLLMRYRDMLSIQITMDGDKETHDKRRIRADGTGTFDEICNSIDKILDIGIYITLRINVDKENLQDLAKLKQIIEDKKWGEDKNFFPYVSPVQDFSGASDTTLREHELLQFLIENRFYGCEGAFIKGIVAPVIGYLSAFFNPDHKVKPWKMDFCEATSGKNFCFSPDGKISTCLTYVGKGNHTIGTFDKNGIIIDENAYQLWMGRNIFRIAKCRECKYALLCGGGCPVAALEQNKNIDCVICSDIEKTLELYINIMKPQFLASAIV
ncbi:MAG: hypothetical protein K0R46_433 [Herbinix sp.]|nr:hypothetical protein [Herbinix sp.]